MGIVRIPAAIWSQFMARHGGKYFTITVRLRDGREFDDIRVDADGFVIGTLFDNNIPSIEESEIVSIRSFISPWFG